MLDREQAPDEHPDRHRRQEHSDQVSRILEPTSERRVIPRFEIGMLPHFLLRGGVLPVEEVVDVGKPHRDYRCDNPNREVDELTGDGREQGYGSTGPS